MRCPLHVGSSGLVSRLTSGNKSYEVFVLRSAPDIEELVSLSMGDQALTGVFRLLEVPVRREGGLGVTMAAHGRVAALVPGGAAEQDGHLAVGDIVGWVDRRWVGKEPLTKFVPPQRSAFRFTVLRPLRGADLEAAQALFPPPALSLSLGHAGWPPATSPPVALAVHTVPTSTLPPVSCSAVGTGGGAYTATDAEAANLSLASVLSRTNDALRMVGEIGKVESAVSIFEQQHGAAAPPVDASPATADKARALARSHIDKATGRATGGKGARAAPPVDGARAMSEAEMALIRGLRPAEARSAGGECAERSRHAAAGGRGVGDRGSGPRASAGDPCRRASGSRGQAGRALTDQHDDDASSTEESSESSADSTDSFEEGSDSEDAASTDTLPGRAVTSGVTSRSPAAQSSPAGPLPPSHGITSAPTASTAVVGRSRRSCRAHPTNLPPLPELGARGEDEAHTEPMDEAEVGGPKYGPKVSARLPLLVLWDMLDCPLEGMDSPEKGEQHALRLRFRTQTLAGDAPCRLRVFTTREYAQGPAAWLIEAARSREVLGHGASILVLSSETELPAAVSDELYAHVYMSARAEGLSAPSAILISSRVELVAAVKRLMLRGVDVSLAAPANVEGGRGTGKPGSTAVVAGVPAAYTWPRLFRTAPPTDEGSAAADRARGGANAKGGNEREVVNEDDAAAADTRMHGGPWHSSDDTLKDDLATPDPMNEQRLRLEANAAKARADAAAMLLKMQAKLEAAERRASQAEALVEQRVRYTLRKTI